MCTQHVHMREEAHVYVPASVKKLHAGVPASLLELVAPPQQQQQHVAGPPTCRSNIDKQTASDVIKPKVSRGSRQQDGGPHVPKHGVDPGVGHGSGQGDGAKHIGATATHSTLTAPTHGGGIKDVKLMPPSLDIGPRTLSQTNYTHRTQPPRITRTHEAPDATLPEFDRIRKVC